MLFKKTKNSVFPFKITGMGRCVQKHIAFSDYKVIFSNNLTTVHFKGIFVDLGAIALLTRVCLSVQLQSWALPALGLGRKQSAPPGMCRKTALQMRFSFVTRKFELQISTRKQNIS